MDIRQQSSIAILIDCWALKNPVDSGDLELSPLMYQNIIDELDNWPGLKFVLISSNGGKLHDIIKNHRWKTQYIETDSIDDLIELVNKHIPDVANIIMLGKSWDLCLVGRPLGWMSIKSFSDRGIIPKFRFLTIDKCTLDKRIDDPKSISKWTDLENASRCELVQDRIYEIVRY